MYAVFDFLTYSKTVGDWKNNTKVYNFKFALEGDAQMALVLFSTVQFWKIFTYFLFEMLERSRDMSQFIKTKIKNEALINISFLVVILAIMIMNLIEEQQVYMGITKINLSINLLFIS